MSPAQHKGKKKIAWRKDLEILARLPKVQELRYAAQYPPFRIAQILDVSPNTVRADLRRIATLALEHTGDALATKMAIILSEYEQTQKLAYDAFKQADKNSLNKSKYLDTMHKCTDSKAKVQGLMTERHEVTGEIGIRRYIGVDPAEV